MLQVIKVLIEGAYIYMNIYEHIYEHAYIKPETTSHFLLRYHLFQVERTALLNDIKEIDERIISDNTSILDQILLYGNENYNHDTNKNILLSTIKFCIDSKRFDMPLL